MKVVGNHVRPGISPGAGGQGVGKSAAGWPPETKLSAIADSLARQGNLEAQTDFLSALFDKAMKRFWAAGLTVSASVNIATEHSDEAPECGTHWRLRYGKENGTWGLHIETVEFHPCDDAGSVEYSVTGSCAIAKASREHRTLAAAKVGDLYEVLNKELVQQRTAVTAATTALAAFLDRLPPAPSEAVSPISRDDDAPF